MEAAAEAVVCASSPERKETDAGSSVPWIGEVAITEYSKRAVAPAEILFFVFLKAFDERERERRG